MGAKYKWCVGPLAEARAPWRLPCVWQTPRGGRRRAEGNDAVARSEEQGTGVRACEVRDESSTRVHCCF